MDINYGDRITKRSIFLSVLDLTEQSTVVAHLSDTHTIFKTIHKGDYYGDTNYA